MALHILQGGTNVGGRLGESLGTGLQALAQHKMGQLQQRQQQARNVMGLEALGLTPQQAQGLSQLDPQALQEIVKSQLQSQREKEFQQAWTGELGQVSAQNAQQQLSPQAQLGAEGFPAPRNSREAFELAKIGLQKKQEAQKESRADIQAAQKETMPYYQSILDEAKVAKKADMRLNKMENLIEKGDLPVSTFYNIFKKLEEDVHPTYGAGAGAAAGGLIGSIVPGVGTAAGAAIGGAAGALISPLATIARTIQRKTSPDTEEFEKLQADFVRDAKSVFGSRITDADLRQFMQMIPTLSNTDSGKKAIIKNMKSFNKAAELKSDAMREIIKENNGRRPLDLQFQVEERIKPELDKIAEDFEKISDKTEELYEKIKKHTGNIYYKGAKF